ncbi:hypothetical protein H4219_000759 [Mycoemilia scoparia]|uniref:SCP domain-containing protein n=1 Tax=Mycoemilia scoparia TaxID=417184 RepID=A0A9W8A215_9FUNG|nr:hypothetical protein H4219_000759 [Mycoemilia scoparia]
MQFKLLGSIVALAAAISSPSTTSGAAVPAQTSVSVESTLRMACLVNSARSLYGLRPLVVSASLTMVATQHSSFQASKSQMTHSDSIYGSLGDRLLRLGSDFSKVAENIAMGGINEVDKIFRELMGDSAHFNNIMDPKITAMGLGCVNNYWTQEFSAPMGQSNIPQNVEVCPKTLTYY